MWSNLRVWFSSKGHGSIGEGVVDSGGCSPIWEGLVMARFVEWNVVEVRDVGSDLAHLEGSWLMGEVCGALA